MIKKSVIAISLLLAGASRGQAPCPKGEVRVAALAATPKSSGKTPAERQQSQSKAVLDLIGKAPADARLIVLPEAILTPTYSDDEPDYTTVEQAKKFALTLPGPNREPTTEPLAKIAELARARNAFIHVPVFELDEGKVYNTVLVIGPDRKVRAKHRKVNLVPKEKPYLTPGTHRATQYDGSSLGLGRVGVAICADIYDSTAKPHLMEKFRTGGTDVLAVSAEWMEAADSEEGPTKGWSPKDFATEAWRYLNNPDALPADERYSAKLKRRPDRDTSMVFSNTTDVAPWTGIFGPKKLLQTNSTKTDGWTAACLPEVTKVADPQATPGH